MPHPEQVRLRDTHINSMRQMPHQTREERWNTPITPSFDTESEAKCQTRMLERIQATLDLIVSKLEVKTQASGLLTGNGAIEEYEKLLLKDRRLI